MLLVGMRAAAHHAEAIEQAERQVEEQEKRIGQVAQGGGDAAKEIFELQKMQLLLAILREGRERLAERLSRLN